MKEALAHDAIYPHIHPHSQLSATLDLTLTVLFLSGVLAVGKMGLAVVRKILPSADKKSKLS